MLYHFFLKCTEHIIWWRHIFTKGNQSVGDTHSVPYGPPPERRRSSSAVTTSPWTRETNCPESFSSWLLLSSFHTEPILNKHSHTYKRAQTRGVIMQQSIRPPTHAHAHPHTQRHSLLSLHAKTGVTATRGELMPSRLEQMKRRRESQHMLCLPSFPRSPSVGLSVFSRFSPPPRLFVWMLLP